MTQPTSCMGGATQPPHSQPPYAPALVRMCPPTWVINRLNWQGGRSNLAAHTKGTTHGQLGTLRLSPTGLV